MLPRRCKKCSCYIAPHLDACPRCGKASPRPAIAAKVPKLTREEKTAQRAKLDAKVPVIRAAKIHWIPSAFSLDTQRLMIDELKRRIDKADSARLRNAIRSELRLVKAHLARADVPDGKHAWTTENLNTKIGCICIYISPKKRRYVLADRDDPADLLIEPRKKLRSIGFVRLQRFEKSRHARNIKKVEQEDVVHTKRKKEKKKQRAKKRLLKRKSP